METRSVGIVKFLYRGYVRNSQTHITEYAKFVVPTINLV